MIGPILSSRTFSAFRSEGVRVRSGCIQMIFVQTEPVTAGDGISALQLGFAINRRFGSAVKRNRARRRMRHGFGIAAPSHSTALPSGGAFLLSAKPQVLADDFTSVVADIQRCLQKLSSGGAFVVRAT